MITVILAVYRDFWPLPWFRVTAVNIGILYAISVFKRSLLSKFCSTFPFQLCTGYVHGHLINFACLLAADFETFFLSYLIKFRILMLERRGVSCSHFLLIYVYGGDDYLVDLKVVSETTKCSDFTVIFPIFFKNWLSFCRFLPWFSYSPTDAIYADYSNLKLYGLLHCTSTIDSSGLSSFSRTAATLVVQLPDLPDRLLWPWQRRAINQR